MKTVNLEMNAGDLKGIIDLPNYPDDQPINITVSPANKSKRITEQDFDELLTEIKNFWAHREKNEVTKTFDEYRMERLEEKYGPFN